MMEIILAAGSAWALVYPMGMSKYKKPLGCDKCLAAWLCLLFSTIPYIETGIVWWQLIPKMLCSMCLVLIINRLISK
jgi:hypothetical protein